MPYRDRISDVRAQRGDRPLRRRHITRSPRRWTRTLSCSGPRSRTKASIDLLGQVRAKAYDAVINGYECAGGSIRIHQKAIQALNFKALGMSPEKARERFGFFLDALDTARRRTVASPRASNAPA